MTTVALPEPEIEADGLTLGSTRIGAQAAGELPVQAQPDAALTVMSATPPLPETVSVVGVTPGTQAAPAWLTATENPPTRIVEETRGEVLGLAATEYATVPVPVPEAPDVTVIHEACGTAVQLHPDDVVTCRVPVSPPGLAFTDWGATA